MKQELNIISLVYTFEYISESSILMYRITILCFLFLPFISGDDNSSDFRFFIESQINKGKEIAKENKDVFLVAENKTKALLIFCNGNFESVRVHSRKRNFGMNFNKMEFFLFDKENGKEITFQHPERFRSFKADGNDIRIQKDTFKAFTAEVTSNSEFFREFIAKKRKSISGNDFVDLQIFDFREKEEK